MLAGTACKRLHRIFGTFATKETHLPSAHATGQEQQYNNHTDDQTRVGAFLAEQIDGPVDFEIDDALAKLERFGIVSRREDGSLEALEPSEAARRLDEIWDDLYRFA